MVTRFGSKDVIIAVNIGLQEARIAGKLFQTGNSEKLQYGNKKNE